MRTANPGFLQLNKVHSEHFRLVPIDAEIAMMVCFRWLDPPADQEVAMQDRWLSVDEIAEYLGVSKDTIYGWVSNKGMPGHKVGRFWKFKREEIDEWVRAGRGAMASPGEGEDKE